MGAVAGIKANTRAAEEYGTGALSSRIIWGSQQQENLRVSAAEESGVSAAEEYGTGGLSCRRIGGLSSRKIYGSQQQKNLALWGLSSRRIWDWGSQLQKTLGSRSSKGVSAACRDSNLARFTGLFLRWTSPFCIDGLL